MPSTPRYNHNVFVNCPFDVEYREMFRAIVFTIIDCGFNPRCGLEIDDGSLVRISKIEQLIEDCRYGVHDLSRTEVDRTHQLPRFNMPLELGLFLGAKRYGEAVQRRKSCLILDGQAYRYQKFISDIAGQDVSAHGGDYRRAIALVRNWLQSQSRRTSIPGGGHILQRHEDFQRQLPEICERLRFDSQDQLPFNDYVYTVAVWLKS